MKTTDNTGKPKCAVVYVRVSTEDQKKGLSLEVQEKLCRERAEKENLRVLEVLDDGGISGHEENRSGINRIKELIKGGKISAVIALSSDRVFRNAKGHLELMDLIFEHGIRVLYVHQMSPEDNAVSRFSDMMLAGVNEFYRNQISDKVRASLENIVEAGYLPSYPPPGYLNVANPDPSAPRVARKIVIPDPVQGALVTELFRRYATGDCNVFELTELMTKRGLRSKRGGTIAPSRVHYMLRNRFYIGELRWGKIVIKKAKHEPLVDEFTFNRVQQLLDERNHRACRRRKYRWLLNGFLYCQKHNRRYTAEWHLKKNIAYYHCSNPKGCGRYIEMNDMESKVADTFKELEFSQDFIDLVIEKARAVFVERRRVYESRRQGLINQRTSYETKRGAAEDKLFRGVLTDSDFARIRTETNDNIALIDEQLADLEAKRETNVDVAQEILLLTRNIYKAYKKASPNLKRQYLAFFWEKFTVQDGVIISRECSPLFESLLALEKAFYKNAESVKSPYSATNGEVILPMIESARQGSNLRPSP